MASKKTIALTCLLMAAGQAGAAVPGTPAFGAPVILPSAGCPANDTQVTHTDDRTVMSILRGNDAFVEAPLKSSKRVRARCRIDIAFSAPLAAPATLQIDMRGAYIKGAQAEASYGFRVGPQHHQLTFSRGETLEGTSMARRFLVDLPRGTAKIKFDMKGMAKSLNAVDQARVDVESLDMCFVDPAVADSCGARVPAPATPAAAPGSIK